LEASRKRQRARSIYSIPRTTPPQARPSRIKLHGSSAIGGKYCHGADPGARFGFGCLISLLIPAPHSGCLDLGKSVVTSLRMSRSWKECRHLAPDVSILERVSVKGPGCIREDCMSCVVMRTYVSMSIYVSCAGMSRGTYGSCENCVYKEGCLPCFVFFFSSCNLLYSIRNINLVSVSSIFSVSTVSPYRRRSSSGARPCPTRLSDTVRLSVRQVRPTLSISLSDMSI